MSEDKVTDCTLFQLIQSLPTVGPEARIIVDQTEKYDDRPSPDRIQRMLDGLEAERLLQVSAAEEERDRDSDIEIICDSLPKEVNAPHINLAQPVLPILTIVPQLQPVMTLFPVPPKDVRNASVQVTDGEDATKVVVSLKCPVCLRVYTTHKILAKHVKRHSDRPIKCLSVVCAKNHEHDIVVEIFDSLESALDFGRTRDTIHQFLLWT